MSKRYLADTHVLLWTLNEDVRLSPQHRSILTSGNDIFFSAASVWEIAIKTSIGKLKAPDRIVAQSVRSGFLPLGITPAHAEYVAELAFHHRDPFDRLLIAQAKLEDLILLSVDASFHLYDVEVV